jgi:hypothetical protein
LESPETEIIDCMRVASGGGDIGAGVSERQMEWQLCGHGGSVAGQHVR